MTQTNPLLRWTQQLRAKAKRGARISPTPGAPGALKAWLCPPEQRLFQKKRARSLEVSRAPFRNQMSRYMADVKDINIAARNVNSSLTVVRSRTQNGHSNQALLTTCTLDLGKPMEAHKVSLR